MTIGGAQVEFHAVQRYSRTGDFSVVIVARQGRHGNYRILTRAFGPVVQICLNYGTVTFYDGRYFHRFQRFLFVFHNLH